MHLSERTLESLRLYRYSHPLIEFVRSYRSTVDELDARSLRTTIGSQLLAPKSGDALFELMVGFSMIDSLEELGLTRSPHLIASDIGFPFEQMNGPFQADDLVAEVTLEDLKDIQPR
jgi:hypothetical protein